MKKDALKVTIFVLLLSAGPAVADDLSSSAGGGMHRGGIGRGGMVSGMTGGSTIGAGATMVQGHTTEMRSELFRQLLSSDGPGFIWPSFPRTWIERFKTDHFTSSVALFARPRSTFAGARTTQTVKYSVKTTYAMIISARSSNPRAAPGISQGPLTGVLEQRMFETHPVTGRNHLKVSEEFPSVGFCLFEMSMNHESFFSLLADLKFFSILLGEWGQTRGVSVAFVSNFFQIRRDWDVSKYHQEVCGDVFRREVKDTVEREFALLQHEMENLRENNCYLPQDGEEGDPNGDESCRVWHGMLSVGTQNVTIPRCERQWDGALRCIAKGKENVNCPIYQNESNGQLTANPTYGNRFRRVTNSHVQFFCDQHSGLSCQPFRGTYTCRPGANQ